MTPKHSLAIVVIALTLAACATSNTTPVASGGDDDDAVCQSRGYAQGSPDYAACRRDRDVQRNAATARADRRQRGLAEYMLNHPERP